MILYRHADPRFPFLWEDARQPAGRWHAADGPVQYFSDTPDGAWAEFLRHEEITTSEDLATVRRALWVVEVPADSPADHVGEVRETAAPPMGLASPSVDVATATGGVDTYTACQLEARRLRAAGAAGLAAPSAALAPGSAGGFRVHGGLRPGVPRNGRTIVLFGPRPDAVGWRAVAQGRPADSLLEHVHHFPR